MAFLQPRTGMDNSDLPLFEPNPQDSQASGARQVVQPLYDIYSQYPAVGYGVLATGIYALYKASMSKGTGRLGWLTAGAAGTYLGGSWAYMRATAPERLLPRGPLLQGRK